MLAKLIQSGGINAIARQLGETPSATLASARSLMPGLRQGLHNFPGGIAAVLDRFASAGGVEFAAAIMGPDPVDISPGEAMISLIGGIVLSPDDGTVENADLRLRVAPLLAMLVVGYLMARVAASDLTHGELETLLFSEEQKHGSTDEDSV